MHFYGKKKLFYKKISDILILDRIILCNMSFTSWWFDTLQEHIHVYSQHSCGRLFLGAAGKSQLNRHQ